MKALFSKDDRVGLHRGWFLAFLWMALISLSAISNFLGFRWPFSVLPVLIAMTVAACFYGMDAGRRGLQCGPPVKSWILARKMVVTAYGVALIFFAVWSFSDGNQFYFTDWKAFSYFALKISVLFGILIVLCRYGFIIGVKVGYSNYRRRKENTL